MKKIIYYLFIIVVLFSPIFVFAEEYKAKQLIPVESTATVSTEKFVYQDFKYNDTMITFGSITNNSISKVPVTINLLLFDSEQKNIGFISYCTNKDYGSNYEGFKLEGNQSSPFSIKVVQKYFVKNKGSQDVKYISVLDENKYCKIGGYSNYKGLTIDEIVNGISEDSKSKLSINRYIDEFKESGVIGIIIPIAIILIIFIIYGNIINALYKKMYSKSTALAYLPIGNVFVTFRLAFGKIVAFIGLGLYVFSLVFVLLKTNIINYIVTGLDLIAFLLVIIKLITKKYDLFYMEPSIETKVPKEEETPSETYISDTQEALDLSYGNADDVSLSNINENTSFDVSSGDSSESKSESLDDDIKNDDDDDDDENRGSDLTNFFR